MMISISLDEYTSIIDDIAQDARGKSFIITAGDFNSWVTEWGSRRTSPRRSILLDAFASINICLMNVETKNT